MANPLKIGSKGSKDSVEKFKELVLDLHRGIPEFVYFGFIEKTMPNEEIRQYFFDKDVFVKSKHKHKNGQDQYFLGVNGIILASNYKMEALTKKVVYLTKFLVFLTLFTIGITVFTVIKPSIVFVFP